MPTDNLHYIVVYDGDCPFCRRQVARIERRDRWRRFELAPRQTPGLMERFPKLAEGDFNTGMRVVLPDGRIAVGADAVYEIARRLPRWRWLAWLYVLPPIRWLAQRIYAWIAANRMRLGRSSDDGACNLEASESASRQNASR